VTRMADVPVNVVITGNADEAVKALNAVKGATENVGKSATAQKGVLQDFLKGIGGITAAVAGGQGLAYAAEKAGRSLIEFGKSTLRAADDLQALESRAKVIYGDALPGVTKALDQFASQVGRSHSDLLDFASGFAAIAEGANLPKQAVGDMSVKLAQLTTDFGSFHHLADDDAFRLIQGGLLGMGRQLARYGVVLNETTLQQYLFDNGLKTQVSDLSEAQLVTARYNFLLDKTKDLQGDAAKNADSFANEMKNLSGQWKDFEEVAGTPLIEGLAEAFAGVIPIVTGLRLEVEGLIGAIKQVSGMSAVGHLKNGFGAALGLPVVGLAKDAYNAVFGPAASPLIDLNSPGLSVPLESPAQTAARRAKELRDQLSAAGGGGASGSGGKKAADELAKAEKAVADAFDQQAKATKDGLTTRREELTLRQRLGILTKEEGRELDQINRRIAFKKDLVDETTKAWEKQSEAVKQTETKVKDLTDQIVKEQQRLKDEVADIEKSSARDAVTQAAKVIKEINDIKEKASGASEGNLTSDQSYRVGQLQDQLKGYDANTLTEAGTVAGLSEAQLLERTKQQRIQDATDKATERTKELQDELDAENKKLQATKDAEFQKYLAVVNALSDRSTAVKTALDLELKAVQDNVTAQIAEYNRLRVGAPAKAKAAIPAFAEGGIVTRPTIALVGEAGPEAIVPLTGKNAGGGISVTIQSVVIHKDADPDEVMRKLAREIQKQVLGAA
jgi:hypothetical protein